MAESLPILRAPWALDEEEQEPTRLRSPRSFDAVEPDSAILADPNPDPEPLLEAPWQRSTRMTTAPLSSREPVDDDWEITKGFKAGIDQLQGMGYGLMGAATDMVGLDSATDWALEGYQEQMRQASEHEAKVGSFTEVKGPGDALSYALYGLGNLAPMMMTTFGTGGVGGLAARGVAKRQAAKMGVELTAKKAASAAAKGAMGGAFAGSTAMETGSIMGDIHEKTGETAGLTSLVFGAAAGALEIVVPLRLLKKLGFGNEVKDAIMKEASDEIWSKIGKGALKNAGTEAVTELAQTIIERTAVKWIDSNQDVFTKEGIIEMVDAGILGGLGGGVMTTTVDVGSLAVRRADAMMQARSDAAERGGDATDQELAAAEAALAMEREASEAADVPTPRETTQLEDDLEGDEPLTEERRAELVDTESVAKMTTELGDEKRAEEEAAEIDKLKVAERTRLENIALDGKTKDLSIFGEGPLSDQGHQKRNQITDRHQDLYWDINQNPEAYEGRGFEEMTDKDAAIAMGEYFVAEREEVMTADIDAKAVARKRQPPEVLNEISLNNEAELNKAQTVVKKETENLPPEQADVYQEAFAQAAIDLEPLTLPEDSELQAIALSGYAEGKNYYTKIAGQRKFDQDKKAEAQEAELRKYGPDPALEGEADLSALDSEIEGITETTDYEVGSPEESAFVAGLRQAATNEAYDETSYVRQPHRDAYREGREAGTDFRRYMMDQETQTTEPTVESATEPAVEPVDDVTLKKMEEVRKRYKQGDVVDMARLQMAVSFQDRTEAETKGFSLGYMAAFRGEEAPVIHDAGRRSAAETETEVSRRIGWSAGMSEIQRIAGIQLPAVKKPRKKTGRQVDNTKDDLLTVIAKLGGVDRKAAESEGIDPADFRIRKGGQWVFRANNGHSLDGMAEILMEQGFLESMDKNAALDLIDRAVRGESIYTPAGQDAAAQREIEEMELDRAAEQKRDDEDESTEHLEYNKYPEGTDQITKILASRVMKAKSAGVEQKVIEAILEENKGDSLAASAELDVAINGLEESENAQIRSQKSDTDSGVAPEARGQEETRFESDEETDSAIESYWDYAESTLATQQEQDSFDLSQPTEESLQADADKQAESQKTQQEADTKAEIDSQAGDFVLSGSDSAVDMAEARGQTNLFDQPPTETVAPPSVKTQRAGLARDAQFVVSIESTHTSDKGRDFKIVGTINGVDYRSTMAVPRGELKPNVKQMRDHLAKVNPKPEITETTDPVTSAPTQEAGVVPAQEVEPVPQPAPSPAAAATPELIMVGDDVFKVIRNDQGDYVFKDPETGVTEIIEPDDVTDRFGPFNPTRIVDDMGTDVPVMELYLDEGGWIGEQGEFFDPDFVFENSRPTEELKNQRDIIPTPVAAGMSRPADFRAAVESAAGAGVVATEPTGKPGKPGPFRKLTKPMIAAVVKAAIMGKNIVVDSGIFSEYQKANNEGRSPKFDYPLVMQVFKTISDQMENLSDGLRLPMRHITFVAPDMIGNQGATLTLLDQYKAEINELFERGHDVIIPFHAGLISQSDMVAKVKTILTVKGRGFIAGIPSNAEAMPDAQLRELLEALRGEPGHTTRIHLLGAVQNKAFQSRMKVIEEVLGDMSWVEVTADASILRGKIKKGQTAKERKTKTTEAIDKAVEKAKVYSAPESRPGVSGLVETALDEGVDKQDVMDILNTFHPVDGGRYGLGPLPWSVLQNFIKSPAKYVDPEHLAELETALNKAISEAKKLKAGRTRVVDSKIRPAINPQRVEETLQNWQSIYPGVKIKAVKDVSEIPAKAQSTVRDVPEGMEPAAVVWMGGDVLEVFIFPDRHADMSEINDSLAHEIIGHYGFRALMGKDADAVLLDIYKNDSFPEAIQRIAKERNLNLNRREHQLLATEEWIAELAQVQKQLSVLDRVTTLVREGLRKVGLVTAFSENDIHAMLAKAHRVIKKQSQMKQVADSLDQQAYVGAVKARLNLFKRDRKKGQDLEDGGMLERFSSMLDPIFDSPYGDTAMHYVRGGWGKFKDKAAWVGLLKTVPTDYFRDRTLVGDLYKEIRLWVNEVKHLNADRENRMAVIQPLVKRVIDYQSRSRREAEKKQEPGKDRPQSDFEKMADLMHEGTLEQVDPSEELVFDEPRVFGNRAFQKRKEKKWVELSMRYDKLPTEAKEIYQEVKQAYIDLWNDQKEVLLERINALEVEHQQELERAAAEGRAPAPTGGIDFAKLRLEVEMRKPLAPYFPLARFGEYWVAGTKRVDGSVVAKTFSRFENIDDAKDAQKDLIENEGYTEDEVLSGRVDNIKDVIKEINPKFAAQVEMLVSGMMEEQGVGAAREQLDAQREKAENVRRSYEGQILSLLRGREEARLNPDEKKELKKLRAKANKQSEALQSGNFDIGFTPGTMSFLDEEKARVKDAIQQMFLESLPDMSMRKHMVHRKGIAGYSNDVSRTFAHSMFHGIYQITRLSHATAMESALRDMDRKQKDIGLTSGRENAAFKEILARHEDVMNPQIAPWSLAMNRVGFVWFLGFSPASAMVNISQVALVSAPAMWAKVQTWNEMGLEVKGRKGRAAKKKAALAASGEVAAELSKVAAEFMGPAIGNMSKRIQKLTQDVKDKKMSVRDYEIALGEERRGLEDILADQVTDLEKSGASKAEIQAVKNEIEAFGIWTNSGVFTRTRSHDVAGIAEMGQRYEGKGITRSIAEVSAYLFHNAEVFNRQITAMAMYRIAVKRDGISHADAVEIASEIVSQTHFDYSNSMRASLMAKDYTRVMFLFKQYAVNMAVRMTLDLVKGYVVGRGRAGIRSEYETGVYEKLQRDLESTRAELEEASAVVAGVTWGPTQSEEQKLEASLQEQVQEMEEAIAGSDESVRQREAQYTRDFVEARRRLIGILGVTFMFAGVAGLPLFRSVMWIIEAISNQVDDDDEELDAEAEFRAFLYDTMGESATQFLMDGSVNALTGLEVASRVSLSELFVRSPSTDLDAEDYVRFMAGEALGPMGQVVLNFAKAGTAFSEASEYGADRSTSRAVEFMLPKAFRDLLRTRRFSEEGARNYRGDPIKTDLSAMELAGQALGFSPADLNLISKQNRAIKRKQTRIQLRRTSTLQAYYNARQSGNPRRTREAVDRIRDFNKQNPRIAITTDTLERSMRGRARASSRSMQGINVDRRLRYLTEDLRTVD